jgi:L-aspartate oxidase
MRRFIFNQPLENLPVEVFDVVIAGAGLSGLYAALRLDSRIKCAILVKEQLSDGNSYLAQGGIAAVVDENDHFNYHLADTLKAAGGLADAQVVDMMVKKGPSEIARLTSMGVRFDTAENGILHTTMEGAHSRKRIIHCGGDATGKIIMDHLIHLARNRENITILENHFLTDILTDASNQVCGAVVFSHGFKYFKTSQLIIATGGIGALYEHTTNCKSSTADGIAAALRAGATMMNMEFVQFHPTAFYEKGKHESYQLISEAVRGEGGILRNAGGYALMEEKHPLKDLAPRDIVSREIFFEMQRTGNSHVFLDITSRSQSYLENRFPTVYALCAERGIKMENDMIPVIPVQHYFMGGIQTGSRGKTSISGLYACGEAACTGVHGANRLASNSLLECLVFASRAAGAVSSSFSPKDITGDPVEVQLLSNKSDISGVGDEIRSLMQNYGGIVRNGSGLKLALSRIQQLLEILFSQPLDHPHDFETLNMAMVSEQILHAAYLRKEGVGSHFRSDSVAVI